VEKPLDRFNLLWPAKTIVWTYTDDRPTGIHHFQILDTNGRALAGRPLR
jgi:hypothetical protein